MHMENLNDTVNDVLETILSALLALVAGVVVVIKAFRRVFVGLPGAVYEHPWVLLLLAAAYKLVKTLS